MLVPSSKNGCWCWWHLIPGRVSILCFCDMADDAAVVAPRLTAKRSSHADWLWSQRTVLRGAVILNDASYVKHSYHTNRFNHSHSPTTVHWTSRGQRGGADHMPTGCAALTSRLEWPIRIQPLLAHGANTPRAMRRLPTSTHRRQ